MLLTRSDVLNFAWDPLQIPLTFLKNIKKSPLKSPTQLLFTIPLAEQMRKIQIQIKVAADSKNKQYINVQPWG